ncbi:hypothetical protein [uncultured Algibacter sp.]|uniref:hypothetical protein n=1 Tax=uncultured Algibacter sp. TaxID=298659 RepID=UPI00262CD22A|nr:hypothetical protein [uncultured Algibacter sp.]
MKKSVFNYFLVPFFFLLLVSTQCDDDIDLPTQEVEHQELTMLKTEIENLASSSVCNETSECKFSAFGSKPCGGPWSYIIYSTSIDTDKLEALIENYNNKEDAFNTKWGIVSDCSLAQLPSSVECKNNTCVPVF